MYIRKLVKAGETSHTISLPKSWLNKHKLGKGDSVFLTEQANAELVITPHTKSNNVVSRNKEISIRNKDIGAIQREVTGAYVNNYSSITLVGDVSSRVEELRSVIHYFVALEITEQTAKRLVVKDMLNISEVSAEKTVKRMDMIIRSMLLEVKEAPKNIYKNLTMRDLDVNRLYFLMQRIVKQSLENSSVMSAIGLTKKNVFAVWDLSSHLENLGDALKNISGLISDMSAGEKKWLMSSLSLLEENYLCTIKAYYKEDKESAHRVAESRMVVLDRIASPKTTHAVAEASQICRGMLTDVNNIARLVIDKDE
jgi:phosphate uptake regulator